MNNKRKILSVILMFLALIGSININAAQKVMIPNVPLINQHPELPTGCEATALTMLLRYHGLNITKQQVAKDMPKAARPVVKNGKLYGEHPNNAFLGDPFSTNGFGIFSPAIIKMIDTYLPGRAENLGGSSFDKVYKTLDEGRPVMIWSTIGMVAPTDNSRWITPNGSTFTWKTPEHAVVAVGYDNTYIYINDPYSGTQKKYKKDIVEKRWEAMGRQAVAIKPIPIPEKKKQITAKKDAMIEGIKYTELIAIDEKGEWIPLRTLEGLHGGTDIDYDPQTAQIVVTIKEEYPIPSNISKWLAHNTQGKREAIPRNINGKYYVQINLDKQEDEIITYNPKGKKVNMFYQLVEGVTYINKEWVQSFYDFDIK